MESTRSINRPRHAVYALGLLFSAAAPITQAGVWGELDVGDCFLDPDVITGDAFDVECTDTDSGFIGSGAIRGEIGALGARLTKSVPSEPGNTVPAFGADTRWFEYLAFTSDDPRFVAGGNASLLALISLTGAFSESDPGDFFELDLEFGVNQTGGSSVTFGPADLGPVVDKLVAFVFDDVWVSPTNSPDFSNATIHGLTLTGNGAFDADFFGTSELMGFTLAENPNGSGAIPLSGVFYAGANGDPISLWSPMPVSAPVTLLLVLPGLFALARGRTSTANAGGDSAQRRPWLLR